MVLLILEAHGPLYLGRGVDKAAQGIARKGMIVAAGIDVLEFARLSVAPLGVDTGKEKAFDFVGGIEGVTVLFVLFLGIGLEHAPDIGGIDCSTLVDDFAEDQYFASSEVIGGGPIKGAPVDSQAQVALPLGGKSADRGAVKGEVVPALDQEFLVVVEHVQAAFQVAEENGDGLDAFFVGEVFQPFFLNLVLGHTILPLLFRFHIQRFEFVIREREKIAQFVRHGSPSGWI